jgi:uncharacterized protein YecE (DUF72 family)
MLGTRWGSVPSRRYNWRVRQSSIRIGTSGWSYPSGRGAWTGIVYPARKGRRTAGAGPFDELAAYAEHFDTVEVNSTFYGIPTVETTRGWVARTPSGFEFSVKLFQKLTHPRMFLDRLTRRPAGAPAIEADPRSTLPHDQALAAAGVSGDDIDAFRRAIDPLASAGKLGAILAQFPASFTRTEAAVDHLAWLTGALHDYRVAVELRHKTWSDDVKTTLQVLNQSRAAWVQIDEPKFRLSIAQNYLPNVEGFYYLRLHGRNARHWWTHDHAADRYDYLYSQAELDPFVEIAQAVTSLVKKMYLYTNNHFEGKAAANAVMLRDKLGLPTPGGFPAAFVEHYPALAGIVETAQTESSGLFESTPEPAGAAAPKRPKGVKAGRTS